MKIIKTNVYTLDELSDKAKDDDESGKNLIYTAKEATMEQIASLIKAKQD